MKEEAATCRLFFPFGEESWHFQLAVEKLLCKIFAPAPLTLQQLEHHHRFPDKDGAVKYLEIHLDELTAHI